jgi:hypothetical protein
MPFVLVCPFQHHDILRSEIERCLESTQTWNFAADRYLIKPE